MKHIPTSRTVSGLRATRVRVSAVVALATSSMLAVAQLPITAAGQAPSSAAQQAPARPASQSGCRVTGTVMSGTTALPGATVVVHIGERVVATSADLDGKYTIIFGPSATYHVTAELTGFSKMDQDLTLGALPCDQKLDFALTLAPPGAPRAVSAAAPTPAQAPAVAGQTAPANAPAATAATAPTPATPPATAAGRAGGRGGRGQTPAAAAATGPRFTQLNVQADATGAAAIAAAPPDTSGDLAKLLPPGFSEQGANADAVAINGSGDALSVDRGVLNDRLTAIGRGEFDPSTGQFAAGFGPAGAGGAGGDAAGGIAGDQGFGGGGGGGRGGPGGGPGGGIGGRGFALGGRGGRGQSLFQGSATYTYGGSPLDATNLQPRNGVITPVSALPFASNNVGGTFGGPLIIPGIYKDTNRRTNFQVNYTGNHSTQLQDQYMTVPTDAERNGDFSSSSIQLTNPKTGLPYTNNQIPVSQMDPTALALLGFIPHANVPGVTTQNFHAAATTLSTSNSVSARITQNLSPTVPGRGAGARGAGGGGRGGGAGGGRGGGGRGGRGLNIMLSAQLQYRENEGQQFNAVPGFSGTTKSTNISAPISLNISRGRTTHNISVNVTHQSTTNANPFTNGFDAAGAAGILYPNTDSISTLPLNYGVPNLRFSNFNLGLNAASVRKDTRITTSYTYSHPFAGNKHQVRIGVDYRHDGSLTESNSNARGSFTYTGLYTTQGAQIPGNSGADFADFLLGLPQQATLQAGGNTQLREHAFDAYLDDNWQTSAKLTLSLGIRYEVTMPYFEANGQMANLDVTPAFTAASVVTPGMTGPLSGTAFGSGLIKPDWNNVSPRLGFAYRMAKNTIVRGGYSITYNPQSYASIARSLTGQPPFAFAETNVGSLAAPITTATGLSAVQATTTNNYGVDPNYALGMIQTYNATVTQNLYKNWTMVVGYTGTKGTDLDLLRAPNRNADGTLRIDGVQAFTWESSGGHSLLNLANFQLRRRLQHGFSGGLNYTLAKSMDNASSLGSGGAVVAQNDQNLPAEYALSNFDQRHNFVADLTWELPFGVGRKWFSDGKLMSKVVGEWSMNLTFTAHSGSPFTPRVVGATSSVANGTSGALRADLTGTPIAITDPSLVDFFNTGAFSAPPVGDFGDSPRNVIIGPGGHVVNAQFSRDMRIGGNRAVSLQINANNLFNTIQWTTIDTNYNSQTFGQVTRFAGMRTVTANLRFRF